MELTLRGSANGPSLIGVGAASVHFQVATGRMPMAAPGAQAPSKEVSYTDEQIAAMSAWVASLAPGPAIPSAEQLDFARRRRGRRVASCSASTAPNATRQLVVVVP